MISFTPCPSLTFLISESSRERETVGGPPALVAHENPERGEGLRRESQRALPGWASTWMLKAAAVSSRHRSVAETFMSAGSRELAL